MDSDEKDRAIARLAAKIDDESKRLPYRWGYFQGAILLPWSLVIILGTFVDMHHHNHDPRVIEALMLIMGYAGLPLGVGLLLKKKWALPLVYAMFGLTLLLTAVKVPVAMIHYKNPGDLGSAVPEAELLLIWLLSFVYYRKRRTQFR